MRKKVAVFFISETDFDPYACKYLILSLNEANFQSCFEFQFPEFNTEISGILPKKDDYEVSYLFEEFSRYVNRSEKDASTRSDYYIGITNVKMGGEDDFFWVTKENKAIITTKHWQKKFSPPSVFEYIISSIAGCLAIVSSRSLPTGEVKEHQVTRGCFLDYAYNKKDNKVDVALGYVCDECRVHLQNSIGKEATSCIEGMCSRKWLGEVEEFGSPAHNLKKFFKVDLDKDTGFYKTFWEKVKDSLPDLPREAIIALLAAIFGVILARAFT
jgi:hypothetical protein